MEPLSLDLMLEPNDKMVGKTHHDDIAASSLLSPSFKLAASAYATSDSLSPRTTT
jgi:hypothetical protein